MMTPKGHAASLAMLVVCTLMAGGCASANSTMLSDDIALISAEGSDRDKVVRDALAEAARLTSMQGYRYFVVLTADDLTRRVVVPVPGQILQFQPARANAPVAMLSGRHYGGSSTYTTPDRTEERIRPAMDIMIRMYRPGDIDPQMEGVLDAEAVLALPAFVDLRP